MIKHFKKEKGELIELSDEAIDTLRSSGRGYFRAMMIQGETVNVAYTADEIAAFDAARRLKDRRTFNEKVDDLFDELAKKYLRTASRWMTVPYLLDMQARLKQVKRLGSIAIAQEYFGVSTKPSDLDASDIARIKTLLNQSALNNEIR